MHHANKFIYFPTTAAEKTEIKQEFYDMANMPSVLGCIDGTHVRIVRLKDNEAEFVNCKNYHYINVQVISNSRYRFCNVVARWPGSTHHSFIFNTSNINIHLNNNHTRLHDGIILGDSGYSLLSHLMVLYPTSATAHERSFNRAYRSTRSSIERAIEQVKKPFT